MFADLLKKYRTERNLSLQKVADLCEVKLTPSYIHRLERADKKNPTFKICIALSKALDMDLREVFQSFNVEDVYEKAINKEIAKKIGPNVEKITANTLVQKDINEIMEEFCGFLFARGTEEDIIIHINHLIEKLLLIRKETKKRQFG